MRDLKIAYGNSRQAKFWSNKTIRFADLCDRLKTPVRTSETAEEYPELPKSERDRIKDKGGFVAGHLRGNRRQSDKVECRSMLVYDLDSISREFLDDIGGRVKNKGCYYTTHSHLPDAPRARLVIPVTRDMTPDEFNAVARYYAADSGFMEMLDSCSFSPHQLMYWPTCPSNGEYLSGETDGEWLNPDTVLAAHPNWQDCSLLPTTPKESKVVERTVKKQKDPLEKDGVVGAVCRAYTVQEIMAAYLSDVYAPADDGSGRYDYIPGEGSAGVVVYDDKFAYSHHATDPAGRKLCNAFDLVRIHKFGDLDERQSYSAAVEFMLKDERVGAQLLREKQENAKREFEDWTKGLEYDKSGLLLNSLHNIVLIMENDGNLKGIVFNQLADGMEIKGEVPWNHPARFWRDADDAQLICYVDANYGTFSARNYQIAVQKVTDDRSYHPIREMFESLPPWDGKERLDTLLIDYLGAEDNQYVRQVTRKTLCAAYMRVYHPGIKYDTMLVLNGDQGIGKSTLIAKLGMDWYSDSLSLSDMNDKTAAEKLQGYWIMEIGELAGMKKADIDKVKAFVSRQDDKYRASFGRRVTPHPRQCVFFGTTNSENGYLRDITGNRRFWNVKVSGRGKSKPWDLALEDVRQIWAETALYAKAGEKLYLEADLEQYAKQEQRAAMEQDEREGIVREYLDMLLPDSWDGMDIYQRREFVRDRNDPTQPKGTVRRNQVSNIEIWCECFGKPKEDLKPADSYAIAAIMTKIEGWTKPEQRRRIPIYGLQRLYRRE
ncbi:MAG: virulence-associated E family protein [Clostridium sp.]|nr:virulence-associated E family protein [Clostridium sp.]MCM1534653.1 virulence-associated E family protein [Clostridium sp.]